LPVAPLFACRRGPIDLLGLPPRPGPRRLPALLAAIALPRQSRMKPLLTSFEQAPPRPRPALQPLAPAARLIFGMACRTLGRAQGRSLLPEALSRRGRHSPPGRSRIFASIRDQQLYRKDRMRVGVSSLSRSLFPRQRRRGCQPSLGSLFPNQFFFLLPVSQYLLFETSSTAPGVRSPPPNIGGVVPAGPLKWLPSPPPLTMHRGAPMKCLVLVRTSLIENSQNKPYGEASST
jgi:hypothetical protein